MRHHLLTKKYFPKVVIFILHLKIVNVFIVRNKTVVNLELITLEDPDSSPGTKPPVFRSNPYLARRILYFNHPVDPMVGVGQPVLVM